MDSKSLLGCVTDKQRYVNALTYLYRLDKGTSFDRYPQGWSHSVYINSYIKVTISRDKTKLVTVLLRRKDNNEEIFLKNVTVLTPFTIELISEEIVNHFLSRKNNLCSICKDQSGSEEYCELCSLLQCTYKENTCPICMDDSKTTTVWRKLPCHHLFHHSCIKKVVNEEQCLTCPICRSHSEWSDSFIY